MYTSELLKNKEYDFLRTNEHLGERIIMLGLAGSYAYGTNNENSDIDIRGVALNRSCELIGLANYEQYVDDNTDTTIYTFNKIITLLLSCNPNTIELLGMRTENYLYLNEMGRELIDNADMFLSKRAIGSFGGYADAQLRRLQNALERDKYPQPEKEVHLYNSIKNAMNDIISHYQKYAENGVKLYIDKSDKPEMETEIFMDNTLKHYPLRDYVGICNEMNNIVKDYNKLGRRNKKKDDDHLNKHAMHLLRLFMMAIDILEKEKINTYRENELDLLLSIRRGDYQKSDGTYKDDFYALISDYEKRLEYAAKNTALPDEPDMNKVSDYVMAVNKKVILNGY
ncbi:MAG: nucleotidyltransferase domain-containing protein [Firmicutes bacterium]|nr:nucleotidyltransferase domain-containing protein [Bacillota bacterium]